jgi:hypothetical protein
MVPRGESAAYTGGMDIPWGWVLMWIGTAMYVYRGTMTGPLRADAAGERERPFQVSFVLDAARLLAPMGVILTLAAWPELDHDSLKPGLPIHLQLGILAAALGFVAAMVVLRLRKHSRQA